MKAFRSWGSGGQRQWRKRSNCSGRIGTRDFAVHNRSSHLQQEVRSVRRPPHLLAFVHSPIHEAVDRRLHPGRRYWVPTALPASPTKTGIFRPASSWQDRT
jgi:hypothetical protein